MSSLDTITDLRHRVALIALEEIPASCDDRWPPLATVAFVVTTSGGLWTAIIVAVRQLLA